MLQRGRFVWLALLVFVVTLELTLGGIGRPASAQQLDPATLVGRWEGTIDIAAIRGRWSGSPDRTILIRSVVRQEKGWAVDLGITKDSSPGAPLETPKDVKLEVNDTKLTLKFTVTDANSLISLALSAGDATTLTGTRYSTGAGILPFRLKKISDKVVEGTATAPAK